MSAVRSRETNASECFGTALRSGQSGYVLVVVLTVMLVCTTLVAALLSLTVDSNRVEDSGRVREREIRAAEGAIEASINQIRNAQSIAAPVPWTRGQPLVAQAGGCEDFLDSQPDPANPPTGPNPQLAPLTEVDGIPVRVACTDQGGQPPAPPSPGQPNQWIPADNGGPSLRLVGAAGYTRNWVDKMAMPWASALGASYFNDPANRSTVQGSRPSLLHVGKAPLRVVGGLEVRNQVVALRDPLTATVAGPGADAELDPYGEAIEVTGYAAQGGPGLYPNSTGGTGCGVASPSNIWGVQSSMLTSSSDLDTSTSGFVCNEAALAAGAGAVVAPGAGDWTHKQTVDVRTSQRNADPFPGLGLPTSCAALKSNGVVNLSMYTIFDRTDTAILNQWFVLDGINDCPNTTYYFGPGDFWFDAWDPGNPNPDFRSTLRFDDYTSDWVFGAALESGITGWDPALGRPSKASFPKVCDQNQTGASIVLSARTGLWHAAGRVAICGPRGPVSSTAPVGSPVQTTAIWQRSATAMGDRLGATTPNTAVDWSSLGTSNLHAAIRAQDGSRARTAINVPPVVSFSSNFPWINFRNICWSLGGCSPVTRTFTAGTFENLNGINPGSETINSASIDLTASSSFVNGPGSSITLTVNLNGGGTCTATTSTLPVNFVTRSFDLGNCGGALNNRTQLRGASVVVSVTMVNTPLGFREPGQIAFEIDSLQLRTAWKPRVANTVTSPSGSGVLGFQEFTTPSNARTVGDGVARTRRACDANLFGWACTRVEWFESRLDFQFEDQTTSGSGLLDGFLPLTSARVDIDMSRIHSMWSTGGPNYDRRLVFTLTTQSGATCTVDRTRDQLLAALPATSTRVDGAQIGTGRVTLDLLGGTGPCSGLSTGDLVSSSASLLLRASNECTVPACTFGWDVDAITLSATADGYDKPATPFRVRWSPYKLGNTTPGDPGEPGDASFNVVGSTYIATNEVEVDFDGTGRPVGQPIFQGGINISNESLPGLVAASLATKAIDGAWPNPWTKADSDRLPDPITSNGTTRPPIRRVLLTACIVTNADKAASDQQLVRRVQAEVDIRDDAQSGGAVDIGREVQVRRWRVLQGLNPIATGAAARVQDCQPESVW